MKKTGKKWYGYIQCGRYRGLGGCEGSYKLKSTSWITVGLLKLVDENQEEDFQDQDSLLC